MAETEEARERIEAIKRNIRLLSDEQRCEIFSGFGEFCPYCGRKTSKTCQCWNDE